MIGRRTFIAGLWSAAAWPVVARAQQPERVRRIGVLITGLDENDPEGKLRVSAFTQALSGLDWTDSRNVRMDLRWHGDDTDRIRALARELVGLQPDIIMVSGTQATAALQRETRTIPVVFAAVSDPVASGIVPRLDRPGGNITGFAGPDARWKASGLSCSRRSRPGSSARLSCSILTCPPHRLICPHLRRRPDHSRSCRSLRTFIAT